MKKNTFEWFRLDNAAKIFPGQNSREWSNVFRFGAELDREIDPVILRQALDNTLKRIPTFNVRIRKGAFWYYFEKNPNEAPIMPDIRNICHRIKFKENKGFLFRLYYRGNTVHIDVYHSLCDGYGAVIFLSTLVGDYLRLCGEKVTYNNFVLDTSEPPRECELEDAYNRYADSKAKFKRADKWFYHHRGTKSPMHLNYYTIGTMSVKQVHKISKDYGVTVTELFAAMLIDILYRKQLEAGGKQREICAQIPVNLRKFFPSETLRNFVLCLRVVIDPNLGEYTFEEILRSVSLQLKLANDKKLINALMTENLKLERHPVMKYLPLDIKNLGIAIGFAITAEQTTSTLLSNVGYVNLPEDVLKHVVRYSFYTGAGMVNGARCATITVGDQLGFSFSNCYEESDLEREFFTRLVKMGVHVKIESNRK